MSDCGSPMKFSNPISSSDFEKRMASWNELLERHIEYNGQGAFRLNMDPAVPPGHVYLQDKNDRILAVVENIVQEPEHEELPVHLL